MCNVTPLLVPQPRPAVWNDTLELLHASAAWFSVNKQSPHKCPFCELVQRIAYCGLEFFFCAPAPQTSWDRHHLGVSSVLADVHELSRKKIIPTVRETAHNEVCGFCWVSGSSFLERDAAVEFFFFFLLLAGLWAPLAKCHPVPLHWREGRSLLLPTSPKHCDSLQFRWMNISTGKRRNMCFWFIRWNVPLN